MEAPDSSEVEAEASAITAVSALWPVAGYGAHPVAQWGGHCMITKRDVPEFAALLQLTNILLPNMSSNLNAALSASSAHYSPHMYEPMAMTRLGHYAFGAKEFRALVKNFAD
eukprot:2702923-Amphidinium_carterae.3